MDLYNRVRCLLAVLAVLAFVTVAAVAQETGVQQWSFDRSTFDFSADPCGDFYQHVCGAWSNPANIPADLRFASWARYFAAKANDDDLKRLLLGTTEIDDPEARRLRTFVAACMTQNASPMRRPVSGQTRRCPTCRHLRMPSPAPPPHRWCGPPPRAVHFGV